MISNCVYTYLMMTSSNGNIFRVTGPLCGEFTGPGEFPAQRPVTRSFGVFFDLRLNKRLSKQSWGWWFEMPPWSLWRQCNVNSWNANVNWLMPWQIAPFCIWQSQNEMHFYRKMYFDSTHTHVCSCVSSRIDINGSGYCGMCLNSFLATL